MDQHQQYYNQRAKEYENIYQKPERQFDLEGLHIFLQEELKGANILEIACGTGYWTETISKISQSVHACDYNESVLEIAKEKTYGPAPVTFEQLDFWKLQKPAKPYDIVIGGFIWSHILLENLPALINLLRQQISKNGKLIFFDNKYIKGSSTPISRTDKFHNTYQMRKLLNGKEYEVVKNFPEHVDVLPLLIQMDLGVRWITFEYYWGIIIQEIVI